MLLYQSSQTKLPRLNLKWLLMGSILGSMIVFWIISISIMLVVTWKETSKTYDYNLKESAHLLFHMAAQQKNLGSKDLLNNYDEHDLESDRQYYQVIQNGQVIFYSRKGSMVPFVSKISQKRGFYDANINGIRWRVFVIHSKEMGIEVQVAQSIKQRQKLLWELVEHLGGKAFIILFVLGVLIGFIIYTVLRPLLIIAMQVSDRGQNNLDLLPNPYRTKELHIIVSSINTLLAGLNKALQTERQFTANAAHELRTHLARLDMKVQLLQRKQPDLAEYFNEIRSEIHGYTHMVSNLLLLARLDPINGNIEQSIHFENLNLELTIQNVIKQLQHALDEKSMHLLCNLEETWIWSSQELLSILIYNLLDNAIKYCPTESDIIIELKKMASEIHLSIADNGPGVSDETVELLSQRFYRELGSNVTGSGLGLSIVNEICKALHISVNIKSGQLYRGIKYTFILKLSGPSNIW